MEKEKLKFAYNYKRREYILRIEKSFHKNKVTKVYKFQYKQTIFKEGTQILK